jgi:isocitrate dehydrogenase (NAD+)
MEPVSVVRMSGDGIGPEVMSATCRVLEAAGARIKWVDALLGRVAYARFADTLPEETLELLRKHKYGLKGPTETIQGGGLRSANVRMREQLDLYAGFRPARTFQGIADARPGVNVIVWREGTEGLYAAHETIDREARRATVTGVFTYDAMARLVRRVCSYMRHHSLTTLTRVGKSNII